MEIKLKFPTCLVRFGARRAEKEEKGSPTTSRARWSNRNGRERSSLVARRQPQAEYHGGSPVLHRICLLISCRVIVSSEIADRVVVCRHRGQVRVV